jgi:hypothetical protein
MPTRDGANDMSAAEAPLQHRCLLTPRTIERDRIVSNGPRSSSNWDQAGSDMKRSRRSSYLPQAHRDLGRANSDTERVLDREAIGVANSMALAGNPAAA